MSNRFSKLQKNFHTIKHLVKKHWSRNQSTGLGKRNGREGEASYQDQVIDRGGHERVVRRGPPTGSDRRSSLIGPADEDAGLGHLAVSECEIHQLRVAVGLGDRIEQNLLTVYGLGLFTVV